MRETQQALSQTRDTVDTLAMSVSKDNRINSKMLVNFEKTLGDITMQTRNMKDTIDV